jgi:hypothetical protein
VRDLGTAFTAIIAAAYDAHASAIYGLWLRSTAIRVVADVTQEGLRSSRKASAGAFPTTSAWLTERAESYVTRARRASAALRLRLVARESPTGPMSSHWANSIAS